MATNAAFYHHPDGTATERPKLMGRHMAGAGFLAGYARHAGVPRLYAYTQNDEHFADFERRVIAANPAAPPRVHIPRGALARVAEAGCLSVPSPAIEPFAWARRHGDQRSFSLCGVIHSAPGTEPMDAIGALVTAPVQSWDAVVCPSQAIRRAIEHVLGTWRDYLGSLAGARPSVAVELPVIPHGVDADAFAGSEAERTAARAALGIGADEVVVLFVGRMSYHAKANPYPLFVALEDAAARAAKPVRLVMAGWFANEAIEAHFRTAAQALCRRVTVTFIDGRTEAGRSLPWRAPDVQPWRAADVFASLVDNSQETFGLALLEAMASGLPVVATDWDGYRDTVRHGVDGFLVPTVQPEPGAGADLALRFHLGVDSYDRYIGGAALAVAVDIGAAAEAFARLIGDGELRRRMGAAGRARARTDYSWSVIVRRYQELWSALAERRSRDSERAPRPPGAPAIPLRDDPFAAFACFPTHTLGPLTVLARVAERGLDYALAAGQIVLYARDLLPTRDQLMLALAALEAGPRPVAELTSAMGRVGRGQAMRGLVWLLKVGVVRRVP